MAATAAATTAAAFFDNLLILGFEPQRAQAQYHIPVLIDSRLFQRSNPKVFEVVIHFLLEAYDAEESKKASSALVLVLMWLRLCVFG